mmetsp:Transcript_1961/g.4362  ORF Transcript_1961/g.4362 Transcript_1961/m.4362 type:complete len:284 (-) Transcript_1961:2038-2889(-)
MIDLAALFAFALMGCGAALQEFAASRKHAQSVQRNCNDSRATLLLYLSLGVSLELMSLGLVSFFCYCILRASHIAFTTVFFYRAELRDLPKVEILGCLVIALSSLLGFIFSPALNPNVSNSIVFIGILVLAVVAGGAFWMFKSSDNKSWLELSIGNVGTLLITSNKLVADMVLASLDVEQPMGTMMLAVLLSVIAGISIYILFNYSVNHIDPLELRLKYYTFTVLCGFPISLFTFGELVDINIEALAAAGTAVIGGLILVKGASRLRDREIKFNELGNIGASI